MECISVADVVRRCTFVVGVIRGVVLLQVPLGSIFLAGFVR
jgi:hypothetical protein